MKMETIILEVITQICRYLTLGDIMRISRCSKSLYISIFSKPILSDHISRICTLDNVISIMLYKNEDSKYKKMLIDLLCNKRLRFTISLRSIVCGIQSPKIAIVMTRLQHRDFISNSGITICENINTQLDVDGFYISHTHNEIYFIYGDSTMVIRIYTSDKPLGFIDGYYIQNSKLIMTSVSSQYLKCHKILRDVTHNRSQMLIQLQAHRLLCNQI